jgi:hypothetical protein
MNNKTNEELNKLAAEKVMGWETDIEDKSCGCIECVRYLKDGEIERWGVNWNPCENPTQAFMLVDKLDKEIEIRNRHTLSQHKNKKGWFVYMNDPNKLGYEIVVHHKLPGRAIVEAALKAMSHEG